MHAGSESEMKVWFGQTRNLLVWFALRHTEPSVKYKSKPAANKRKERKETSEKLKEISVNFSLMLSSAL